MTSGHCLFAAAYDWVTQWSERRFLAKLRAGVVGGAAGRVLEVGAGTGANFRFYRPATDVVATEPDPFMLERARRKAAALGCVIRFEQCPAEALPFPDATFDTVVATLVLCTVEDPRQSLAEIRRVLKPNGVFRFLEHVRSEGHRAGQAQDLLTPLWGRFAGGCHLNRQTAAAIAAAGFEIEEIDERRLSWTPLSRFIFGVARRTD